jgi:flavodoxin
MRTRLITLRIVKSLILLSLLLLMNCIGPAQQLTPSDMSVKKSDASSLVVVHSRSGNTAKLGQAISEKMRADYIRLEVPAGSGDSLLDFPNRNETVAIKPLKVDMSKYQFVFLGSPIWAHHPTAFIYTFVKNNDFTSKKVVLFYTYNGGISSDAMKEMKSLVEKQGGTVIDAFGMNSRYFDMEGTARSEMNAAINQHEYLWIDKKSK